MPFRKTEALKLSFKFLMRNYFEKMESKFWLCMGATTCISSKNNILEQHIFASSFKIFPDILRGRLTLASRSKVTLGAR